MNHSMYFMICLCMVHYCLFVIRDMTVCMHALMSIFVYYLHIHVYIYYLHDSILGHLDRATLYIRADWLYIRACGSADLLHGIVFYVVSPAKGPRTTLHRAAGSNTQAYRARACTFFGRRRPMYQRVVSLYDPPRRPSRLPHSNLLEL